METFVISLVLYEKGSCTVTMSSFSLYSLNVGQEGIGLHCRELSTSWLWISKALEYVVSAGYSAFFCKGFLKNIFYENHLSIIQVLFKWKAGENFVLIYEHFQSNPKSKICNWKMFQNVFFQIKERYEILYSEKVVYLKMIKK